MVAPPAAVRENCLPHRRWCAALGILWGNRMGEGAYHGRKPTPLGNLAAPFMRAALVIVVEREHADLPEIRAARGPLPANAASSTGMRRFPSRCIVTCPFCDVVALVTSLAAQPVPAC